MMEETTKYLALYPDGHHEEIICGELIHRGGAEGKIYKDITHKDSVIKIFHDKERSEANRKKLEAMLHNKPNIPNIENNGKKYIQIAWPTALLEDFQGFCVGYLMPFIDTKEAVSLDHLIQKATRKKLGLSERYVERIFAAYNVTSVVAALHERGHYIVDLKPSNVSIYKDTMLVALFDCDGFSIKGEHDSRYPAEYVSEEYIHPEYMNKSCQEMGEEQDNFALAVIIFKLLNEGIHPYSGVPRKKEDMLSIQERIEKYHYAYGMWPDIYQAPHPYSVHDFFDKETMDMFEKSFTKGNKCPSALEWQNKLENILKHLRKCKKDNNHAYFTPKGCGHCIVNEKLNASLENYKKQQQEPQTIRGIDVSKISTKKILEEKKNKENITTRLHYLFYVFIFSYLVFFTTLYKLVFPIKEFLENIGISAQVIIIIICTGVINKTLESLKKYIPKLNNPNVISMLQIYAIICLIITLISINSIPLNLFKLYE